MIRIIVGIIIVLAVIGVIIEYLPKILKFLAVLGIGIVVISKFDLIINNILSITMAIVVLLIVYGIYRIINNSIRLNAEKKEAQKRVILRNKLVEIIDASGRLNSEQVSKIVGIDESIVRGELDLLAQQMKIGYDSFKNNKNEREVVYKSLKHKEIVNSEEKEEFNLD
mgnify:CR=1 FL=1